MTIMARLALGLITTVAIAFIIAAAASEQPAGETFRAATVKKICTEQCAAFIIF